MRVLLLVALGGALGAVARYLIGEFVKQRFPDVPHSGTFAVNMIGCLGIGVIMTMIVDHQLLSAEWRMFLVVGCLGSLTTFSTLGFETVALLREQRMTSALVNVAANLAIGLPSVWAGIRIAHWLRA